MNGSDFLFGSIAMGQLPGHNRTGSNILIEVPTNNTEYICLESNNVGEIIETSEPAFLYIASIKCLN